MCGILLAYGGKSIDRGRFDAARDTLIHRGPDAQNSVFLENDTLGLGHTRLSIIDLSSRSDQPMRDGSLRVIFNGEIYNYPELKTHLTSVGAKFRTTSDTEVLLHGYRHWGDNLCQHLEGMFAFAIWDDEAKSLYLGRDHFGQKPLYYTMLDGQFIAASEIKAIKKFAVRSFRLRKESLIDAMVQDFVAEPKTWYDDIFAVPPGHQMTVKLSSSGGIQCLLSNFWPFTPDPDPPPVSQQQALDAVGEAIENSVAAHMLADVEVGAFLSGGVDSNCIATFASEQLASPIRTFTIGFGGEDELPLARESARLIGASHHEAVVSEHDYRNFMVSSLRLFDSPFGDTSIVPMTRVSKLASDSVKVVLTGDGGDEIFGGYNYGQYLSPALSSGGSRASGLRGLRSNLQNVFQRAAWTVLGDSYYSDVAKKRLNNARQVSRRRRSILSPELPADYDPSEVYRSYHQAGLSTFRNAQWTAIKTTLPSRMLAKVDRCSMAHSLESRSPFLSPRLAELVLNYPREITNPIDNWFKGLLRENLKGKIPESVMSAPKRGFDVPMSWTAAGRHQVKGSAEVLRNCVDAGLIQKGAWAKLGGAPRVQWYFNQIECALEHGIIEC